MIGIVKIVKYKVYPFLSVRTESAVLQGNFVGLGFSSRFPFFRDLYLFPYSSLFV